MQVDECRQQLRNASSSRWTLLPSFMLRQSGFPFAWLDILTGSTVTDLLDQLLAVRDTAMCASQQALDMLHQALSTYQPGGDRGPEQSRVHNRLRRLRENLLHEQTIEEHAFALLRDRHTDAYQALVTLSAVQEQQNELLERLSRAYENYFFAAGERISRLFREDERLQLALLMSNEANFHVFDDWLTHSAENTLQTKKSDRARVNTLTMYLQRFCSKNETASHFGPFSPGQVQQIGPSIAWDEDGGLERRVFFAHWAAEALAARISADPLLFFSIRPRKNPGAVLRETSLQLIEIASRPPWKFSPGAIHHLSREESDLFAACDGALTVGELVARCAGAGESSEVVIERLGKLHRIGALFLGFEIPVGSLMPLADLRENLAQAGPAGQPWLDVIGTFEDGLRRFAEADLKARQSLFIDLKTRFEQITGIAAERGHGRFYADRSILFEECQQHFHHLSLSGDILATIQDELGAFLDLQLLPTRRRFAAEQALAAEWFQQTFGPAAQVPLVDYLERFSEANDIIEAGLRQIDTDLENLYQAIDRTFLAEIDEPGERAISLNVIEQFVDRYAGFVPTLCNPDLLLIAETREALNAGAFRVLVGDCHSLRELLSQSGFGPMMMNQLPHLSLDVYQQYQRLLEEDEVIADIIHAHNEKTATRLSLACLDVEVSGRSPKSRTHVLSITDLLVENVNGKLRLSACNPGSSPQYLRLLAPLVGGSSISIDPLAIFSFPRFSTGLAIPGRGRSHLPRITAGRIVLQRELWRVQAQDFLAASSPSRHYDKTLDQLIVARTIQRRLGMPRRVFAKISGERKPFFVDFEAPLSVQQLIRLLRQRGGTVEFSEMLPGPHELWLEHTDGRVCCEFRLALFSGKEHDQSFP